MCQNSPFIEITLATTVCGEGDFKFMRVSTHPQFFIYKGFDIPFFLLFWQNVCLIYLLFKKGDIWKTNCTRMGNCKGYRTIFTIYGLYLFFLFFFYHLIVIYYACGTFPNSHFAQHLCSCQHILVLLFANGE